MNSSRFAWASLLLLAATLTPVLPIVSALPAQAAESQAILGTFNGQPVAALELLQTVIDEYGYTQRGKDALEQIIQEALVTKEADRQGLKISSAALDRRIAQLNEQIQQANPASSLQDQIKGQGISLAKFRQLMQQAMLAESLMRAEFGSQSSDPIPAEKQALWFHQKRISYGVQTEGLEPGIMVQIGELSLTRQDWGVKLFESLSVAEQERMFEDYVLIELIEQKAAEFALEIGPEEITEELQHRDAELLSKLRKEGLSTDGIEYLGMVEARGENAAEHVNSRRFRANILQRMVAEKQYGEDGYRQFYEQHPELFTSEFGAKLRLRVLFMRAASQKNAQIRRDFGEANEELAALRERMEQEAGPLQDAFDRLARIYSEHASRNRGGDLGFVSAADIKRFGLQEDLFQYAAGTLVGPLSSPDGVALFQIMEHKPAATFAELKDQLPKVARRFLSQTLQKTANYSFQPQ